MVAYRIEIADAHAHLFEVTVTVAQPAAEQRVSLPAWIPGSYLVREFARHVSGLEAKQGAQAVPLQQLDKATWLARCTGRAALTLRYKVYAFDTSVRAAFLDAYRAFFNGTGVFLRVHGHEDEPQRMELRGLPKGWKVATAMTPVKVDARGQGTYEAPDYDELVDHPVELGDFWRGEFKAAGVSHELVVAGALPDFDGERLLADARRACEAGIAFWHGKKKPFFKRYVFMLNAVDDGYGGLEHRASTALIASRRDLPQRSRREARDLSDGYVTLLGLISHEYFHTWNVKRLRPAEFTTYDYTQENYTELLWFFEGFTSYYDDLLLLRAGLIDEPRYLKLVAKTISGVLGMPGRQVQSVAQASFDAWVKYYRTDENTPNSTISYYTKGSLVALALDLTLRHEGRGTLDDVMRGLWERSEGGPISEADIAGVLAQVGGRSYEKELRAWVHGTDDAPWRTLLARVGVDWHQQSPSIAQRLGLRVSESALTGIKVTHVLRGGAGEAAGFAAGDELIAVEGWRLRRLDELPRFANGAAVAQVMVSRDQRLRTLPVALPASPDAGAVSLVLAGADKTAQAALALRRAWLAP
ncbi:MAG: PDZ domain-containing protein [Rhizobacter sp.]